MASGTTCQGRARSDTGALGLALVCPGLPAFSPISLPGPSPDAPDDRQGSEDSALSRASDEGFQLFQRGVNMLGLLWLLNALGEILAGFQRAVGNFELTTDDL